MRKSPTPIEVLKARMDAELSVPEAANVVNVSRQAWRYWERGLRKMDPNTWELFTIKTTGIVLIRAKSKEKQTHDLQSDLQRLQILGRKSNN